MSNNENLPKRQTYEGIPVSHPRNLTLGVDGRTTKSRSIVITLPAPATERGRAAAGPVEAVPLTDLAPHTTWASLPMPLKAAVADNWSLISSSVSEVGAHVSARHRADIAAADQALSSAEEPALRRKTAAAEAQATAVSAEQESARAREALQQARAKGAKRHRGDTAVVATRPTSSDTTSAATRSSPPATSTAAERSSAPCAASTSSAAPSAALAARSGPPQQPPFKEVTITGCHRRSGDQAFLQGSFACKACNPRSTFAKEEATAVVDSARALLVELPEEHLLPVDGAWRLMEHDGA